MQLMLESGYSKQAVSLYLDAINVGSIKVPSVVTTYRGACGDVIKLYLKIDAKNKISDAKFYYVGCPGCASSTSAMTQLITGKTLKEAKKLSIKEILKELEGLPKGKLDCPQLSIRTLRKAIAEYAKMQGRFEL